MMATFTLATNPASATADVAGASLRPKGARTLWGGAATRKACFS